ncbi:MAG: tetratricopeptide repeat protein, partial [Pseudomonadota bacterium]
MSEETFQRRDFFISYNSADKAHAEAINRALRKKGYTTHFAGTDLPDGGNIPVWMDRALGASTQVLALCSPDYFKPEAVYSEVERAAAFWADPDGAKAMLVPVEIAPCTYSMLYAPLKRIGLAGMTPDACAAALVKHLAGVEEAERREALRVVAQTPDIFRVPRSRLTHFTGREQALAKLHETLSRGRNAAVTQAIAGMGGIGKTTLAAEYAHRFGTRGRYGGVWWAAAESQSSLLQSLGDLAVALGEEESNDLPALARKALDHVQTGNPPWLLIYDNLPDRDTLYFDTAAGRVSLLPQGSARTIITSRADSFDSVAEVTPLDIWDTETTVQYLLDRTDRQDREGARTLAEKLDGLPLAADQAAAFLHKRDGISFAKYAADLDFLIKRERDKGAKGEYPETVYATLTKSLDQLVEDGEHATVDLLCLLAWLSHEGTDVGLLAAVAQQGPEFLSEPLVAAWTDDYARDDAIKAASDLALMRRDQDKAGIDMLILHRVTQAALRTWQRENGRQGWDTRAPQIIRGLFPSRVSDVPSAWPLCARLLPHARALAEHGPKTGQGGDALSYVLNQAALYLGYARGDTVGAIEMMEPNVELTLSVYGEKHADYPLALSNLAGRYTDAGRFAEAEETFKKAIEIEEGLLRPKDPALAIRYNNLAEVYWKQERFADAEPLFQRALEVRRAAHGENSAEAAGSTNALGALYDGWAEVPGEEHRRAEATRLKEEAIRIARAVRGERHPDVSNYLHNRAVLLDRQQKFAEAAELELRAVAIQLSLGLLSHLLTQQRIQHLLLYWERSGQAANAERLRGGDGSLLVPEIAEVERLMQDWVAEDPENRHFGTPPFEEHR